MPGVGPSSGSALRSRRRELIRGGALLAIGFAAGSGLWYRANVSSLAAAQARIAAGGNAAAETDDSIGGWFRRAFGLGSQPGRRAPNDALASGAGAVDSGTANPFPKRPAWTADGTLGGGADENHGAGSSGADAARAGSRPTAQYVVGEPALTPAFYPKDAAGAPAAADAPGQGSARPKAAASGAAAVAAAVPASGASGGRGAAPMSDTEQPAVPSQPSANGGGYGCLSSCQTGLCDWNGNCCAAGSVINAQTNCGGAQSATPGTTAGAPGQPGATNPLPGTNPSPGSTNPPSGSLLPGTTSPPVGSSIQGSSPGPAGGGSQSATTYDGDSGAVGSGRGH